MREYSKASKIVNLSLTPRVFAEVNRMPNEEGKPRAEVLIEGLRQRVAQPELTASALYMPAPI
jgi:hypothetical protein